LVFFKFRRTERVLTSAAPAGMGRRQAGVPTPVARARLQRPARVVPEKGSRGVSLAAVTLAYRRLLLLPWPLHPPLPAGTPPGVTL
jgi:hypothetical protein